MGQITVGLGGHSIHFIPRTTPHRARILPERITRNLHRDPSLEHQLPDRQRHNVTFAALYHKAPALNNKIMDLVSVSKSPVGLGLPPVQPTVVSVVFVDVSNVEAGLEERHRLYENI